jgi:hypothetical protein
MESVIYGHNMKVIANDAQHIESVYDNTLVNLECLIYYPYPIELLFALKD